MNSKKGKVRKGYTGSKGKGERAGKKESKENGKGGKGYTTEGKRK